MAQAQIKLPAFAQLDFIFDKQALAVGLLFLIHAQRTAHAQQVVMALALIALAFQVEAEGELMCQARQLAVVTVLTTDTGKLALETALPAPLKGQPIGKIALTQVNA